MRLRAAAVIVALTPATGCETESGLEGVAGEEVRRACSPRGAGSGALVVHYGSLREGDLLSETDAPLGFLDALAGESETVIVTRAIKPNCGSGAFAHWRNKGARFRWAYKLPANELPELLENGAFVGLVRSKIDKGFDYVAIDEIGAGPGAKVDWSNGSAASQDYVDAMEELTSLGYGRRVMPYLARSVISNPERAQSIRNVLATIPEHARAGLVEIYRTTSAGQSAEQHRDYFHQRSSFLEQAVGGLNEHLVVILGVSNRNDAAPHQFLDRPEEDLAHLTRQFSALHQEGSLTRRHKGVGAYNWTRTRHYDSYAAHDLAAHFTHLADWYAARHGVAVGGDGGSGGPGVPPPQPPTPTCNEPDEKLVDAQCMPSCGASGGNTCLPEDNHACDDYGALPSYDCGRCCARPDLLTIYRSYHSNKRTHKYALSQADAGAGGYGVEGPAFAIARDGGGSRAPFHQCLKGNGKLFYTTDPGCEGAGQNHGALGYLETVPHVGLHALHRLYHSSNGAHFYGAGDAERDAALAIGYKYEGVQGYVW